MELLQVTKQEAGQRLDKYLGKYMKEAPKSFFYKMMRKKNITLNGKKAQGMEKLQEGDEIKLFLAKETIEKFQGEKTAPLPKAERAKRKLPLEIVYEDEELLVVNKGQGILSQKAQKGDYSLVESIIDYVMSSKEQEMSTFRPGICNRLDRNTTGLIVAGKTVLSLQYMNRLFRQRDLKKYYLCLVKGKVSKEERLDGYLWKDEKNNRVTVTKENRKNGERIITQYQPLETIWWQEEEYTLLKVHLITGKSHQIRAHLASIGHPIVGDTKYGEKKVNAFFRREYKVKYQLLHGWKLVLGKPEYLPQKYHNAVWTAPLPKEFAQVVQGIGMHWKEK